MKRFTETELAERWSITTRTLQQWRKAQKGPQFIRIGERSIFYRQEDVEAYESKCVVGKDEPWRGTVTRAAAAMHQLAKQAKSDNARNTLSSLSDELRMLLD
jgi:predicted DNA-binding transcriptional regulator AlpA